MWVCSWCAEGAVVVKGKQARRISGSKLRLVRKLYLTVLSRGTEEAGKNAEFACAVQGPQLLSFGLCPQGCMLPSPDLLSAAACLHAHAALALGVGLKCATLNP